MSENETVIIGRTSNGQFGSGNNLGGRTPGANKVTTKIRNMIAQLVEDNLEGLQDDLDFMDPVERVKAITALLPYAAPKMAGHDGTTNQLIQINIQSPDDKTVELNKLLNGSITNDKEAEGQARIDTGSETV